ncbi:MAG: PD-(D/E)XK nuclease family protein [Oscillatoriophycideae cyanobacterium NC_groundwater_1537_Pr4_S-0.65um_50_18]|nr:PD-(D/E)XK nuclease family protein [Oscillatoriophycideae cyanobacterium NC_groundwater_1537_Pr4_S-0.65um_50_18]
MLHLSQGLLNLLSLCPRKFQHTYLDQLNVPIAPEQQERINWGDRFHLLMQQRELGLRPNATEPEQFSEDWQVTQSVHAFTQAVPELFAPEQPAFDTSASGTAAQISRQSEHARSLQFQGYLFTVIYDLLILDPQQAQILDWKTYPRPQNPKWLEQNWQTRLYPFVLAETSPYAPDQISMTYWFVQPPAHAAPLDSARPTPKPECFKFAYSEAQHQQTHQDLTRLLHQFRENLQQYQTHHQPFPQTLSLKTCESCAFAFRCQRGLRQPEEPIVTLEEIAEVAL